MSISCGQPPPSSSTPSEPSPPPWPPAPLGRVLVELDPARARRLAAAGTIPEVGAVTHLPWAELLQPPPADQIAAHIDARRREHDRLAAVRMPGTLAGAGPSPLPTTT